MNPDQILETIAALQKERDYHSDLMIDSGEAEVRIAARARTAELTALIDRLFKQLLP